jgi:hypothetical protein
MIFSPCGVVHSQSGGPQDFGLDEGDWPGAIQMNGPSGDVVKLFFFFAEGWVR